MDEKTCTKCGTTKPTSEYHRNKKTKKDGSISYYIVPTCKECSNARSRQYHSDNKDAVRLRHRNWRVQSKFGLSPDEYEQKRLSQSDLCAICGKTCVMGRRLAVDHNHTTGAVRGLLCGNCNNGLGRFMDSPELLQRAADYLREWDIA